MRAGPIAATLVLVIALAACGEQAPGPTTAAASPATTASPVDATRSPAAPSAATAPPGSVAPSPGGGDVIRDNTLLAILPPKLDGAAVAAEDGAFDEAATDPAFRRNVARAVFPIVTTGGNLASGVVAQLIPGRYSDDFFRSWRDSYNEGACGQAGGVAGNAEAELDGRTVYIATCAGGLRVYHTYVEERNAIISLFALGEGKFGERLMSDLRP